MAIVGFTFTKISAVKTGAMKGKISINNNILLLDAKDANLRMAQTKKGVRVAFTFESKFEPGVGNITLQGEVVLLEDVKVADEILKVWKEKKGLPEQLMPSVLNHILERSNVEALILSRDLGLPSPVPLPKVNVGQRATKKGAKPAKKKAKKK